MDRGAAVSACRVALALLVAPLPAALFQSLVVAVRPKPGMGVFEHPLSMFVLICLVFYVFELVLGLPLYIAMRRRLPRRMLHYGLSGAAIALIPVLVPLAIVAARGSVSDYAVFYNFLFFTLGGFVAGAIFWRMARPLREDHSLRQLFD